MFTFSATSRVQSLIFFYFLCSNRAYPRVMFFTAWLYVHSVPRVRRRVKYFILTRLGESRGGPREPLCLFFVVSPSLASRECPVEFREAVPMFVSKRLSACRLSRRYSAHESCLSPAAAESCVARTDSK